MARRRGIRTPKTTAFTDTVTDKVNNTIKALYRKCSQFNTVELSHEEGLNMVAPPESVDLFMRAPKIAEMTCEYMPSIVYVLWKDDRLSVEIGVAAINIMLDFEMVKDFRPLIPKVVSPQPIPDDVRERVTSWVINQMQLRRDWGRVYAVFNQLNKCCSSPTQVRFLWPAVMGLLKRDKELEAQVQKLADMKVPRTAPSLPVGLRQALRLTAGTIAGGLLLPEETPDWRGFQVTLAARASWTITEPDLTFEAM